MRKRLLSGVLGCGAVLSALLVMGSGAEASSVAYTLGCYEEQEHPIYWVHEVWGPGNWIAPHHNWQGGTCDSEHVEGQAN